MKRARMVVLVGLLGLIGVAFAANFVHVQALERELQTEADTKVAEFLEDLEKTEADYGIVSSVVVSKQQVVMGPVSGKISVYMSVSDEHSSEPHFEGFEFFYERTAPGDWNQTESGRCSSEECTREGRRLLKKLDEH